MTAASALRLGPIVGHTTASSSLVSICVSGPLEGWTLAVDGRTPVPFRNTEGSEPEFGTAMAAVDGLSPAQEYSYAVRHGGAEVAAGRFRTMPAQDSGAEVTFVTLSCNDDRQPNAWARLARFIDEEHPSFILMVGDQIYVDEGEEDLWQTHLDVDPRERRAAFIRKYEKVWAAEPIATIMANTPVYMTWDDHDIRDGWGSFAADSPTLAATSPEAGAIHARYCAFFDDAATVFYHFQACRNPSPELPSSNARPFALRCGGLLLVVPDSRSDRDFARADNPILGQAQWDYIDSVLVEIDETCGAVAVATSVPVVDLDPDGNVHRLFRGRMEDIELIEKGDPEGLDRLLYKRDNPLTGAVATLLGLSVDPDFHVARKIGFRVADLDDMRDKWSYETNRAEQLRLLTTFAQAALAGRDAANPRPLVFLSGDIHVGAIFRIDMTNPPLSAEAVVTSGIAKSAPIPEVKGVLVDETFAVAPGIQANLEFVVNSVNFAVTRASFSGEAVVRSTIIFEAESDEPA